MKASQGQRKDKSQEGRWARSRGLDKPRRVSEPFRGERGVQKLSRTGCPTQQNFLFPHSFPLLQRFCPGLAFLFSMHVLLSRKKTLEDPQLPSSQEELLPTVPVPIAAQAVPQLPAEQFQCFHLKSQYICSGQNPLPSPQ